MEEETNEVIDKIGLGSDLIENGLNKMMPENDTDVDEKIKELLQ